MGLQIGNHCVILLLTSPRTVSTNGAYSMSEVHLSKIQPEGESLLLLTQQVDALYDEIRRRAFCLFESRGGAHGHHKDDWLDAERSLIFAPPAQLIDEDNEYEIRMAVPGYEPGQIRVNVLPRCIIVDADSSMVSEQHDTNVVFTEFSDRKLLRRIDLPEEIRAYTAKATVKDGMLVMSVRKAAQSSQSSVAAAG
jgi:HSP20 family protein